METSTRQKVLAASIRLIAERGFADSSMRDIAQAVGIRASSLYNHFSSKEAILEAILDLYRETMGQVRIPDSGIDGIVEAAPAMVILMEGYRMVVERAKDPVIGGIVRILVSEMHKNPKVKDFASRWYFEENREAALKLFRALSAKGRLSNEDPEAAAAAYIAIVNAAVQEFLIRPEADPEAMRAIVERQFRFMVKSAV